MNARAFVAGGGLLLAIGLTAFAALGSAQNKGRLKKAIQQDRVVAGGPKEFLEARHLVLKRSNEEIGQALATIARERYQVKPVASSDRFRTRVQRRYIKEHFPILFERMRGAASAFGKGIDDDSWNFGGLWYLASIPPGCSVMYIPPGRSSTNSGIVSRNYDFITGTLRGQSPKRGELAATARPYLIEMHPNRGYASLAICSYDLLSGVLDGINSEGLTVALLADDELMEKFPMEPAGGSGVGLGVLQVLRLLLDTCANVDEAKEALLLTKHYYEMVPVHYLIADRHGKAFVWEFSQTRNREHIIEEAGKVLITTNFSLHRHLEGKKVPSSNKARTICPRYCALAEKLTGQSGKVTVDDIKETHKVADMTVPSAKSAPRPPNRTLWHALYFPSQRKVQVSFYLRDEPIPGQSGKSRIVRSEYLEFTLAEAKEGKGQPRR
jgi:hypothetical protein